LVGFNSFDPKLLRRLDLNKLVVFIAVYRSRSASTAAAMLGVSQPAISNTLRDLRDFFADDLFLRRDKRLHATPQAHKIAKVLEPSLSILGDVFSQFSANTFQEP